ncbi:MAG: hypothetical protein ACHREM_21170 [Polyangiales bacterium]
MTFRRALARLSIVSFAIAPACDFPGYYVAIGDAADATSETTNDAVSSFPDATVTLPDGSTCSGHDEDRDGYPDLCDDCPNVADPTQSSSAIGPSCAPPDGFGAGLKRAWFEPFTGSDVIARWPVSPTPADASSFRWSTDGDAIEGGSTSDAIVRYAMGTQGSGASALVLTTIVTITADNGGTAGLMARVSGNAAARQALICAVGAVGGYAVVHTPDTGCGDAACTLTAFASPTSGGTSGAAIAPFPADISRGVGVPIGLRLSITRAATGSVGTIRCQVFDPTAPATLRSPDAAHQIVVDVPASRWLATGEVGVFATNVTARFDSVDALSDGP